VGVITVSNVRLVRMACLVCMLIPQVAHANTLGPFAEVGVILWSITALYYVVASGMTVAIAAMAGYHLVERQHAGLAGFIVGAVLTVCFAVFMFVVVPLYIEPAAALGGTLDALP
jgi:hypothetical protein